MRYAGLIKDDFVNGEDVCVSVWVQGCSHRCPGCHNPQTWDENGGIKIEESELIIQVIEAIKANGIRRNLSILGGEPLDRNNSPFVGRLIAAVKLLYPDIIIYLWTGYTYEDLASMKDDNIQYILNNLDVLIDGPFLRTQRDVTLLLRGSSNQRILYKGKDF